MSLSPGTAIQDPPPRFYEKSIDLKERRKAPSRLHRSRCFANNPHVNGVFKLCLYELGAINSGTTTLEFRVKKKGTLNSQLRRFQPNFMNVRRIVMKIT